jgi:hypothetical protein
MVSGALARARAHPRSIKNTTTAASACSPRPTFIMGGAKPAWTLAAASSRPCMPRTLNDSSKGVRRPSRCPQPHGSISRGRLPSSSS